MSEVAFQFDGNKNITLYHFAHKQAP